MIPHTGAQGVRRLRSVCLLGLIAASAPACADRTATLAGPGGVHPELVVGGGVTATDAERAALGRVARSLAIALNNRGLRQQLKAHLRAAPFREHKVELASYLRRDDTGGVLAQVASAGGKTGSEVLASLNQVRSVELYMPVKQQRESWRGDADVFVAAQLVEHDPIMAFDKLGNAVQMDESAPPTQPTIVIVGAETRFNQPMPAATSRNANDLNGEAIGTLVALEPAAAKLVACGDDCGGGGGGGTPALVPGLYLEFSRILDMKEPWIRGAPEVEVHIHGSTEANETIIVDDRACAGEHSPDPRYVFDQNDGFWSGRVMVFSTDSIALMPDLTDYHIIFWEDDNDSCTLKLDSHVLREYILTAASGGVKAAHYLHKGWPWPVAAVAFVGTFYSNAGEWMLTNDDYIGLARVSLPLASFYYEENTHVIITENGALNGRANFYWH